MGAASSGRLRLAELIAALSLAIDLGLGQPMAHVLRTCLLAVRLGRALGLVPAVRRGRVIVKPAIDRLMANGVRFVDGSEEPVDSIVCATGYCISLPFLSSAGMSTNGRDFPLYRRIVPPNQEGLFVAGFVDAPGGLLPVVETQGEWIAAVLAGRLRLPDSDQMSRMIKTAERRTRQRFPGQSSDSIRCDPHAYRRLLRSDLARAS